MTQRTIEIAKGIGKAVAKRSAFIAVVGGLSFLAWQQFDLNQKAASNRLKAVESITTSIKDETDAQTKLINRQFQAMCVLIIDTSGRKGLERLDPDTQQRCRDLLGTQLPAENSAAVSQPQSSFSAGSAPSPQSPQPTAPVPSPTRTEPEDEGDPSIPPRDPQPQSPADPPEDTRGFLQRGLDDIRKIIEGVL